MAATLLILVLLGAFAGALYVISQRRSPEPLDVLKAAVLGGFLAAILYIIVRILIVLLAIIALALLAGLIVLAAWWLLRRVREERAY